MNHRLLTDAEKRQNARGRNQRNAQRQARQRREKLLRRLLLSVGTLHAGAVGPQDSLELLTAHLHRASAITQRISRSLRPFQCVMDPPEMAALGPVVPRPTRVLREANRSRIFPQMINGSPPARPDLSLVELIKAAHQMTRTTPHALLDFMARSSGLPWAAAAKLLYDERLIRSRFDETAVATIRSARSFWDRYQDGRFAYGGCVAAGDFSPVAGDWAFFEAHQLGALLPGLVLPRQFRRPSFLTRLVHQHPHLELDIHSGASRLPFVRHPF